MEEKLNPSRFAIDKMNCKHCGRKKLFETEGIIINDNWFCCHKCRTEGYDDAICEGCNRKNRWCVCETPEDRKVKTLFSEVQER